MASINICPGPGDVLIEANLVTQLLTIGITQLDGTIATSEVDMDADPTAGTIAAIIADSDGFHGVVELSDGLTPETEVTFSNFKSTIAGQASSTAMQEITARSLNVPCVVI